jgi:hypothetical protein
MFSMSGPRHRAALRDETASNPRYALFLDGVTRVHVWLFKGTRVPVKALFENLESGARVDDFLEWFPGVTREQVEAVLEHAERSLAVA